MNCLWVPARLFIHCEGLANKLGRLGLELNYCPNRLLGVRAPSG